MHGIIISEGGVACVGRSRGGRQLQCANDSPLFFYPGRISVRNFLLRLLLQLLLLLEHQLLWRRESVCHANARSERIRQVSCSCRTLASPITHATYLEHVEAGEAEDQLQGEALLALLQGCDRDSANDEQNVSRMDQPTADRICNGAYHLLCLCHSHPRTSARTPRAWIRCS